MVNKRKCKSAVSNQYDCVATGKKKALCKKLIQSYRVYLSQGKQQVNSFIDGSNTSWLNKLLISWEYTFIERWHYNEFHITGNNQFGFANSNKVIDR